MPTPRRRYAYGSMVLRRRSKNTRFYKRSSNIPKGY
jgi:hypothetical protein